MKFGVREICNVVFKAKQNVTIGTSEFKAGQPVLYIDSATTSTLEGAATTVYAQGGRGNSRLIAWEGEKTLTFTVEDALLSPIGFSILSGAGLFKKENEKVHVHTTANAIIDTTGLVDLTNALASGESVDGTAPVFVMEAEKDGSIKGLMGDLESFTLDSTGKKLQGAAPEKQTNVFVDFYVVKDSSKVSELQIDSENFAGFYYVEASTLFRDQSTGKDMPAEITLPNVKIQSNFSFSMAATGDPSTFTFTMDAFPGYTIFEPTKKVLCVIQIVEDTESSTKELDSVMKHADTETDLDKNEENGDTGIDSLSPTTSI